MGVGRARSCTFPAWAIENRTLLFDPKQVFVQAQRHSPPAIRRRSTSWDQTELSELLAEINWNFVSWPVVGLIVYLLYRSCICTVDEDERLAIFLRGHFLGFKGPGRVFAHPVDMKRFRVPIGAQGVLVADDVGQFSGIDLPVRRSGELKPGAKIQITGFDPTAAFVEAASDASMSRCPKCGHEHW